MAEYQKYMFDNFIITCDEEKCIGEVLEMTSNEEIVENDSQVDECLAVNDEPEVVVSEENVVNDDNSFVDDNIELEEEALPSYSQDELNEAVKVAEMKGYEKGKEEISNSLEKEQQIVLQNVETLLQDLITKQIHLEQEAENSAMQIAIHAINKILPTLEHDVAKTEVEAFLSDNFGNFRNETSLSFSFHPEMAAQIAPMLSKLADKNDFEGKIAVHKDINLGLSDCKVEWKNGGVERSSAQVTDKIKELIAK